MLRRVLVTALLFVLAFAAAPAMAQTTNGVISGIISDAQGGVLPGVTVTARNVDTGVTRDGTTESDGRFRLAGLLPGRYELKAELQGFGTVTVPEVTVAVSSETTRNVTLQVQGLQESVTVTGEAPVIEVTKTDVSGIVTQDQMQMLPLATRQPMDLALLLPGTNQDAVRARGPGGEAARSRHPVRAADRPAIPAHPRRPNLRDPPPPGRHRQGRRGGGGGC